MPSLLDMRRRIKSVKNTQQITKAMKMVAAAKLKRAQDRVTAARPFAVKMSAVLSNLSSKIGDDFSSPLLTPRGDEKYLMVVVSADKGLCGGFNANLIKAVQAFLKENDGKNAEMIPVGRKARDFFKRRNVTFVQEYIGLTGTGRVELKDAIEIAEKVIKTFTEDETIDKVFLVFTEFKTVLSQKPIVEQLLPIPRISSEGESENASQAEYIYEQPPAEIFGKLLPMQIETQIYRAMLESVASEQGSRMTAMDSASKNAGELIDTLTLEYEPHSSSRDYQRNHRGSFGRSGVVINYKLRITNYRHMIDSNSQNKWRGRIIRYAPLILWIAVIFIASSTQGAMSNTSRFIRPFLEWLFPNTPEEILTIYHGYIRKSAHFIEYAILAFWASIAFWNSSKDFLRKNWYFAAFILIVLTASIDEFNQSFNSQRTGTIYDVLLDASGGLFMILIMLAVNYRSNFSKSEESENIK